ncbi:DNA cytosine methyltransferase [Streptosporangium sp. 'caverna']|uniref:DNA cytosine methyltransferase n=1 Tax=Streptosporangium sp. 'caverna' TaxID=2202249 RepID=UPI000D7DFCD4|nr:DNA (cytosine-5-)-methyltransferase [Streptosporangium sp. 'caverna']AWS47065.1 DNA (cytosine-5-)-methyltransferase [Streptosporangium sp. 'caverna']
MGSAGRTLKVLEICAGAGGQALGLERAGFEHELLVELDANAVGTLRHNRPHWEVIEGDVADPAVWDPSDHKGEIALLAGGVPCPPFTIAGKQLGAGDERDLFAWAVEQVKIVQPRALLLENVRGLSMPRFAGYRQHVLDRLREFGYAAEWRVLNASDYGVPQLRPRFVLIAMASDDFAYFHWPETIGRPPTVGEVLFPLMSANGWHGADAWAAKTNRIAPTIVGGSKKHGGADLGPSRAKKAWGEMGVDGWALANAAPVGGDVFDIGPRLTCEMVARLQGWDDEEFFWEFTGKKTTRYRQIGNAFPPPVAKVLGIAIAAALNRTTEPRERDPDTMHDAIYRILRDRDDFMTITQINKAVDSPLEAHELERRISVLGRDFHIEVHQDGKKPLAYKLGGFKAFLGQEDHIRHEKFKKEIGRIS